MQKYQQLLQNGNWPFPVKNSPFFYGWAIVGFGTLGILMSIPGQTIGVSAFTDPLIEALQISRTELSLAYMFGTIGSALLLTKMGFFYDRWGARTVICLASLVLGFTLLTLSQIDRIGLTIHNILFFVPAKWCIFFAIFCGFLFLRLSGQGVLTMASRNMIQAWFHYKRGFANGIKSIFTSLLFSSSPLILSVLIEEFTWRGTWIILAAFIGIGFTIVSAIFNRNTPQSCGLIPDGQKFEKEQFSRIEKKSWTLHEVYKDSVFWLYAISLCLYSFLFTAVTFHITVFFAESGRDPKQAFTIFLPISIISMTVNFIASWISDYLRLKHLLVTMLISFIMILVSLLYLGQPWGYGLLIVSSGFSGGIFILLISVTWPRFYGLGHLGSISGFAGSMMVFGSAIGPAFFSLSLDWSGSFHALEKLCIFIFAAMLSWAIVHKNPQDTIA
ncbi:MFS transporter [Candidatus Uabimicrobium amorphum]|uniref:MFS transporter n=1 Tax=Uabimicrobium amorphum TaxID=2596890 RepID=A0A5S9IN81_UABAM|nr:MFS transporter [Candidatus Uabimicrobium amorphum]BBM84536.1 MFS transporter [Candidatus Uabimicrobium amorphum]